MTYNRRYSDRYIVPGAKVKYKLENGELDHKPVKDITHSGLCFEFADATEVGSEIEIELIVPGKDNIVLKGNIVWTTVSQESQQGFAATQFLPFGTDERYNTMDDHQKLRTLMKECIENNPPNIKFKI